MHRSAYQLKKADHHTFAIPKVAMVKIQYDEYGSGQAGTMHAELFAAAMMHWDSIPPTDLSGSTAGHHPGHHQPRFVVRPAP